MIRSLAFFFGSFAATLVFTFLLIRYWKLPYGYDHPGTARKQHGRSVLRLGGLPLFAVFLSITAIAPFYLGRAFHSWAAILVCCTMIFGLGLLDDFRPIGARMKLLGQIVVGVTAFAMGLTVDNLSYPVGGFSLPLGAWSVVVTIFWLISVPNLINLIDGIDGLAAGLSFFLYLTLGYVAWSSGAADVALVSFSVAGALLGFLCFNFPPAKIFLGDGGAYFLGFGIAALSLQSAQKGSVAAILLVTIIALGLPIMDTSFALVRRAIRGLPLFRADAEHIHHRLRRIGLSERRVVLLMYLVTVFLSLMALSVMWSQGRTLPVALGVLFLLVVLGVKYLGYIWSWSELNTQIAQAFSRRDEVRYVLASARVAELEVARCSDAREFAQKFRYILAQCGLMASLEPPAKDYRQIEVKCSNLDPLRLWVPDSDQSLEHFYRLAESFRDAYQNACKRWDLVSLPAATDNVGPTRQREREDA